jgi:hypothetical protein
MRQQFRRVDGDRRHPCSQMMMEVFLHLLVHLTVRHLDGMGNRLDVVHHLRHLGRLGRQLGVHLVLLGVLQILDELILGENLPCQGVVLLLVDALQVAMVVALVDVALADVELRQWRRGYCPHVVGAED